MQVINSDYWSDLAISIAWKYHMTSASQVPTTMSICATTTSITFTDALDHDDSSSALCPFSISVSFLGHLPPDILQIVSMSMSFSMTNPFKLLQISVSLPKEYAGFTSPILKANIHPSSEKVDTIALVGSGGDQVSLTHPLHTQPAISFTLGR